jgi:hypothetical protein
VRDMHRYLLLLLVLAAAACGNSGDDDDTGPDAAAGQPAATIPETLTDEQLACPLDAFMLEAVTGVSFAEGEIIPTGDGVSCTFGSTDGNVGIGVIVYGSTGAAAMETVVEYADDAGAVDLDFADDAVWSPSTTTLHALRGEAGAQIQITDFGGSLGDPLQVATELAEIALEG